MVNKKLSVVLRSSVAGLGGACDVVQVAPGYMRNYLMPKGFAVFATKDNIALLEERRVELEKRDAELLAIAQDKATQLQGIVIVLREQVDINGRLFGSIGVKRIADEISSRGVQVNHGTIKLFGNVIKSVGSYEISVTLHAEVEVRLTIDVRSMSEDEDSDNMNLSSGGNSNDTEEDYGIHTMSGEDSDQVDIISNSENDSDEE